jgi:FMN phosphatase YigB (HAD superfamily)
MAEIRGVFFDLYGTLLRYGDMKSAWADWLRCPATSARVEDGVLLWFKPGRIIEVISIATGCA